MAEETTLSPENQVQPGQSTPQGLETSPEGTIDRSQGVQVEGQTTNAGEDQLGPQNLPPELEETRKQLLRDWHTKNQKLAEDRRVIESEVTSLRRDSQTLQGLFGQEWFKEAMMREKGRRNGQTVSSEISDEEFQAATSDKKVFADLVARKALEVVESKYGNQLSSQAEALTNLELQREFDATARDKECPDFAALNDAGLLDPYLEDDRLTYKEAYKLYKSDHSETNSPSRIQEEAEKILAAKRAGSVEKGGTPHPKGSRIVKAKSYGDAFDAAWDAISQGQEVEVEKG